MVIELAADREQFVRNEAERCGVTPEVYVNDLVAGHERYLADYTQAVERGLADVAAGRIEEHEAFFARWYRERPDHPESRAE